MGGGGVIEKYLIELFLAIGWEPQVFFVFFSES